MSVSLPTDEYVASILLRIIVSAIADLFEHQPNVLIRTQETNPTEWNLGHHFANELVPYFPWLDHDLDVIKPNYENNRPDIIFHMRGTNALNFLVVEIKRAENDDESDLTKIRNYWMRGGLQYRFGAYVNIWARDGWSTTLLSRERETILRSDWREATNHEHLSPFVMCSEDLQAFRRVGNGTVPPGRSSSCMSALLKEFASAYGATILEREINITF